MHMSCDLSLSLGLIARPAYANMVVWHTLQGLHLAVNPCLTPGHHNLLLLLGGLLVP